MNKELNKESYAQQVIRGTYFPHIDGIRTLAVLAVVLYHLQKSSCPGGFAGVDVFFVISGYLIGGGIVRDLQGGTFSLADFYTRRIKRIMPAYFGMIIATMLVGLCLFHYSLLQSLGNGAMRSSYFFANFFCYKYLGDYFAGVGEEHPLLNLWSLSVEEQFYMIVPLTLLLFWKFGRRIVLWLVLACGVLSFVNAELLVTSETVRDHVKAFYMLLPRAWELLAGVLLAMLPAARTGKWQAAAATLGFALVIASYSFLGNADVFPGHDAVFCIAGAALLIRYGNSGRISRMLQSRSFVGIGKISYSLYLWHWPVIVYMNYICLDGMGPVAMGVAVALSFLFAYLSWKYLEMPIRRNKNINFPKAIGGLVVVCLIVAAMGAALFKTHGLINYVHKEANSYASLEYPRALRTVDPAVTGIPQMEFPDEKGKMQKNVVKFLGKEGETPDFVLFGDSHAEAMQIGLDDVCAERGAAGLAIAAKTCPLSGIEITNTFSNAIEPFMEWLDKLPQVKRVILVCRWSTRIEADSNQILYRIGDPIPETNENNFALLRAGLLETCRRITATGREVVLFAPGPELKKEPGKEIRRRIILGADTEDMGDVVSEQEFLQNSAPIFNLLQKCEQEGVARVVPIHSPLLHNGVFRGIVDGKLLFHDSNHLSGEGSRHVVRSLYDSIFPDRK